MKKIFEKEWISLVEESDGFKVVWDGKVVMHSSNFYRIKYNIRLYRISEMKFMGQR